MSLRRVISNARTTVYSRIVSPHFLTCEFESCETILLMKNVNRREKNMMKRIDSNTSVIHDSHTTLFDETRRRSCWLFATFILMTSLLYYSQDEDDEEETHPHSGTRRVIWKSLMDTILHPSSFFTSPLSAAQKISVSDFEHDAEKEKTKYMHRSKYNFIADVVERVAPSLVNISLVSEGDGLSRRQVVSAGSGFIVDKCGLILTNAHLVVGKRNSGIQVSTWNGDRYEAILEDCDVQSDLATLRIIVKGGGKESSPLCNLPVMPLGNSSNLRAGEFVIALGCPLSLSNSVTMGVISSVRRSRSEIGFHTHKRRESETDTTQLPDYIQTDATITYGNSGGPLVNLDGEAIGINAMQVFSGISFAIPIDYVKQFLNECEMKRRGVSRRRHSYPTSISDKKMNDVHHYIGISMLLITSDVINELRVRIEDFCDSVTHGVVVWKVEKDSPAHVGGLQKGDVITHINGVALHNSKNYYDSIKDKKLLQMDVIRKGKQFSVSIAPTPIL